MQGESRRACPRWPRRRSLPGRPAWHRPAQRWRGARPDSAPPRRRRPSRRPPRREGPDHTRPRTCPGTPARARGSGASTRTPHPACRLSTPGRYGYTAPAPETTSRRIEAPTQTRRRGVLFVAIAAREGHPPEPAQGAANPPLDPQGAELFKTSRKPVSGRVQIAGAMFDLPRSDQSLGGEGGFSDAVAGQPCSASSRSPVAVSSSIAYARTVSSI